ncbi:hypothetical protein GLAREA_04074 [Glarea lozoyensis ATCC 20868]|uniref:Uncharacterized protein n=1 Tax=Glarea lozoyensis (strain ATCC 20868 / MF5171) TaxID=1116229 RepID=S3CXN7_GLAL2|nr:uncharacterized protein GLAREA_04074 [Glarea lozoyensis ATCC 20868]EPE31107.1 hypothetical protein GLAREA_04074 [Glarea lozoyensis ATCC 20868]
MSQQSGIWGRTNTHNPFEVAGGFVVIRQKQFGNSLYMVEKDQEVDMRNLPAILNPTIERPGLYYVCPCKDQCGILTGEGKFASDENTVIEHMKVTHNVRPLARTV